MLGRCVTLDEAQHGSPKVVPHPGRVSKEKTEIERKKIELFVEDREQEREDSIRRFLDAAKRMKCREKDIDDRDVCLGSIR